MVGEPRETVRSILAKDDGPLPREAKRGGGQRTYDGLDLISWVGFQELRAAGLRAHRASHLILYSGAIPDFVEALEAGRFVGDFCMIYAEDVPDPESGLFELHYKFGTKADVAELAGNPKTRFVVSVSLWRVYLDCMARAAKYGFELHGAQLSLGAE